MGSDVSVCICNSYHPDEVYRSLRRCLALLHFEPPSGLRVLVKPNAVTMNRPEQATATHHAVLDAVCRMLSDGGCSITIGDSSSYFHPGYTMRSFQTLGFVEVAERYGAELVCFEERPFRQIERPGSPPMPWLYLADLSDYDLVINLPKLKVHRTTRVSGAVKNLFGLVPGGTKQLYHERFKVRPDYLDRFGEMLIDVYLNTRPGLNVLDGVVGLERDGPAATGDPRRTRFLLASRDALSLDVVLCRLIGESLSAVPYLRDAIRRGLIDSAEVRLRGDPPKVEFVLLQDPGRPGPLARSVTDLVFRHLLVRPIADDRLCRKCGECANRCQVGAIRLRERVALDMQTCIYCYACPSFCEAGAIRLEGSPLNKALQMIRQVTGV